jgi:hypothetical protein
MPIYYVFLLDKLLGWGSGSSSGSSGSCGGGRGGGSFSNSIGIASI